jgi:hypothetical protein
LALVPLAMPFDGLPPSPGDSPPGRPDDELAVGDEVAVSDVLRFPAAYRFTVTTDANDAEANAGATVSGRVDGADLAVTTTAAGGQVETVVADGTLYVLADDTCRAYPDALDASEQTRGRFGKPPRGNPDPKAEVVDRVTLDGRETLVLELAYRPPELPDPAREARREHAEGVGVERQRRRPTVTYLVDVETGYLRRLATTTTTVDYHSWGDVAPVDPPAVDCPVGDG